ncbi:MAG: GNVR domain-containing protein, partial [Bacteroidales bacterium]
MKKDKLENLDFMDFNDNHSQDTTTMADLLAIIFHHRKWFILSVLIGVFIGFLYIHITPESYSRTATVLVKDNKKGAANGEAATFQDLFSFGSNSVDNEIGFFKSKRLMLEVTTRLNLDISYKERGGLRKTELYSSTPVTVTFFEIEPGQTISFTATILDEQQIQLSDIVVEEKNHKETVKVQLGDTTDTPMGKIVITPTLFMKDSYIGESIYVNKENLKMVSDSYNAKLKVEIANKQSSLINLTIEDENSDRAEDLLNTLIEVYEKDAIDDKNKIVINTANFIKDRLAIIEADLGIVDTEIENYKKKNKLTDITSESALVLQNTGHLDSESLNVENQLNMAEYMKNYLRDNSKIADLIPASIGINDNGIQNQINEYNTIVTKRNKLIANSSANNPIIQDLNSTLSAMRLSVLKAVDNLIAGLKMQVTSMKHKEQENISKISDVPTQQKYVISIERQQKIKEELYLYLLNKKEENELQLSIAESNCRIVDPADGPVLPVAPKKVSVILICFTLGLIIPALCLYIRSLINTRLYTKKEIKAGLSIPFLGEIPLEKQTYTKDIVVEEGSRESICEAFKILRDNLDFMDTEKKKKGKVIQLT